MTQAPTAREALDVMVRFAEQNHMSMQTVAGDEALYALGETAREALFALDAEGWKPRVRVKPLEWEELATDFWRVKLPLFGSIRVENYGQGFTVCWSVPGFTDTLVPGLWETADLAKAAAQSHFDRLVLSALEPDEWGGGWRGDEINRMADAIDAARYAHPIRPRERPHTFEMSDQTDREYAFRLARAAFAVLQRPVSP